MNVGAVPSGTQRVVRLILAFLALRLALAAFLPVFVDETYAIVVSRMPSLSFFDHPTLAFNFSRASIWLFGSEAPFVARLPHVLAGSASAWLLYLITRDAFGEEAGYWAAASYSIAPFFLVSAGTFVVPDGPLNLFLLASLLAVQPILLDKPHSRPVLRWSIGGLMLALALLSKYQAVLFGVSAGVFLLGTPSGRRLLATPGPWIAVAIAILGLVPTLLWNVSNDFVSVAFQSGRAGTSLHPLAFTVTILGQIVYLMPIAWAAAHLMLWRGLTRPKETATFLFAAIAVLPVVIFDGLALLSENALPHWPMAGFLFAFPLVGLWASELQAKAKRRVAVSYRIAFTALPVAGALFCIQASTALFTRPFVDPASGTTDLTALELDWPALREDLERRGIVSDPDAFLVTKDWITGGRAGYFAGPEIPVAPPLLDPRHFAYMNDPRLPGRSSGYAIIPAALGTATEAIAGLKANLEPRYVVAGEPWTITQDRAGYPSFDIVVLPVKPR